MENQDNQNSNIFISLAEASKETGYHQDYLGFLCRNGKLKGMKIGRNWVTTKSALEEFKKTYKNEISEVADESGNEIKVHIQKVESPVKVFPGIHQNILPVASVEAETNIKSEVLNSENSFAAKSAQLSLVNLKKDVLENIEQRVKNISNSVENLEKKIQTQEIETTQSSEVITDSSKQEFQNERFSVPTPFNIKQNFVSNFDFVPEKSHEKNSENLNSNSGLFSQKNIEDLYSSFKVKPKFNSVAIALTGLVAVIGFASSLAWSGIFSGNKMLSEIDKNQNVIQQNIFVKNLENVNEKQTQAGGITIREKVITQNITKVLGPDTNQIASVVTQTLEKYLAEGKFKGEKGDTGNSGYFGSPASVGVPVSYIQPTPGNSNSGGTVGAFTYLNTSNLNADKAILGNTTISGTTSFTGSVTMSGPNTLNGTTTISNLSVSSLNAGFNPGSIIFQGTSGLTEDNNNLFFDNTNKLFGIGTSTPNSTLAVVGSGTSSPLLVASSSGETLFTISSLGLVGIGTTTPSSKLTVQATASASPLSIVSANGTQLFLIDALGNLSVGSPTTTFASNLLNLSGTNPILDVTSSSTLKINTENNRPVTFGSGAVTIPNLVVTDTNNSSGIFTINSNATSSAVFTVQGSALTSGYGIVKNVTANAGNGQITTGERVNITDNTVAGGGYTGMSVVVTGSGSGSGNKYLLDLNPGTGMQVVFDSNGAFRPTADASSNSNSIGSPSYRWKNGYFDSIFASNISGTLTGGQTTSTSWTLGSAETGDVNESLVFQRNSGSGNATLQWHADNSLHGRYLSVNYPFGATYTVDGSSIGQNIDLLSANLTNNATSGTQNLLSLSNTGTGTTTNGILLSNTGTGVNGIRISGSWTNSLIVDSGRSGFGTTTPTQTLSVAGNMQLTGALFDSTNASGTLGMVLQSTGTATLWTATSTLFGGTPIVSTGTNGFVTRWTGASALGTGILLDNGTVSGVNATSSSYTFNIQGASGVNPFNISSSTGTSLFTVLQNGNVGIGTTTPATTLAVQGGQSGYMTFSNASYGGGGSSQLILSTGATSGSTAGAYITLQGKLESWVDVVATSNTAGQQWMRFGNSTGKFSIQRLNDSGTAVAASPFTIENSAPSNSLYVYASGQVAMANSLSIGSTYYAVSAPTNGAIIEGKVGIGTSTPAQTLSIQGTAGTNPVNISSSTGTSLLTVLQNGNVGIGASSPSQLLGVAGSGYLTGTLAVGTNAVSSGFGAEINANSNTDIIKLRNLSTSGYASMAFYDSGNTQQGFFGYANPSASFFTGNVYFGSNTTNLQFSAGAGKYISFNKNPATERMRIDVDSGNVGIGTTTPAQTLSVAGNMRLTGSLFDTNNASGTTGMLLSSTGTGTAWIATSTLGISTASGTVGNIQFAGVGNTLNANQLFNWDNTNLKLSVGTTSTSSTFTLQGQAGTSPLLTIASSSGTSLFTVLANGNVGIGTSTVLGQLDMYKTGSGSASVGVVLRDNVTPTFASNADNLLTVRGSGSSASTWRGRITAGGDNNEFLFGEYNSQAWLGAHNAALDAWSDLYINPETSITTKVYVGAFGGRTNSILTVNSATGFVGINTTSPIGTLAVTGQAGSSPAFVVASSTGARMFNVLANGNVGIGLSNPVASFQIGSGAYTNGNSDNYSAIITGTGSHNALNLVNLTGTVGTYSGLGFTSGAVSTQTAYIRGVNEGTSANTALTFGNWAGSLTEKMRITSAGNVGIGTTTPAQTLSVAGNMRLTGSLFDTSNASGTTGMLLSSTGTGTAWISTSTLGITSASGTAGNIQFAGVGNTLNANQLFNWDNTNLKLSVGTTSTSSTFTLQGQAGTSPLLTIASSTGTSLFTILANGNVGIGTTTSASKFTIQGSALQSAFSVASSSGSTIIKTNTDGSVDFGSVSTPGSFVNINAPAGLAPISIPGYVTSNTFGQLYFNAVTAMTENTVFTTNRLQAGYGFPLYLFSHGVGSGTIALNGLSSNGTYGYPVNIGTSTVATANLYIQGNSVASITNTFVVASSSGATQFLITPSGNVGIGTTTPAQTLSVAGNMRLTGGLFDASNASGTTGMLLSSTGTGTAWIATSTLGITSASGTAGNIQFAGTGNTLNANQLFNWDNTNLKLSVGTTSTSSTFTLQGQAGSSALLNIASSSGSSIMTVLANGNVGVGSSTPSSKLTVSGNSLFIGDVNIGDSANKKRLLVSGTEGATSTGITVYDPNAGYGIWQGPGSIEGVTTNSSGSTTGYTGLYLNFYSSGDIYTNTGGGGFFIDGSGLTVSNGNIGTLGGSSPKTMTLTGGHGGGTNVAGGGVVISSGSSSGNASGSILFQTATPGSSGSGTNFPTTKMVILGNGNVGIGTTSPIATLTVMGTSSAPTISPLVVASSTGTSILEVLANNSVRIGINASSTVSANTASTSPVLQLGPTALASPSNGGTYLGIAALNQNFSGNFIDFQNNYGPYSNATTSVFKVDFRGTLALNSGSYGTTGLKIWPGMGGFNDAVGGLFEGGTSAASLNVFKFYSQLNTNGTVITDESSFLKLAPFYYMNTATSSPSLIVLNVNPLMASVGSGSQNNVLGSWTGANISPTFGNGTEKFTGTSTIASLKVAPIINMATTSTVGYFGLLVNPQETSTSSTATNYIASFQANNNRYLDITSTGRIGIGTSSPNSLFHIGMDASSTANSTLYTASSTNGALLQLGQRQLTSASVNGTYIGLNAPASFSGNLVDMQVNGSSIFKVSSGGTVTIPAGNLYTVGSVGGLGSISSNLWIRNAANTSIGFSTAELFRMSIINSGDIGFGSSIDLSTLAGSNVVFKATGNVGIGTTSPIALLTVMGTTSAPTLNPFVVASSSGASLLTVLANGNMGLGTSTSNSLFALQGSSVAKDLFRISSTTGATMLNVSWYGGFVQNIASTTAVNIQDGSGNSVFAIDTTQSSSNAGLDITAGGSQTGNLLNFYSSGGTFLSGFTAAGGLAINISSTTALNIQNGSGINVFAVNTVNKVVNFATSASTSIASIIVSDGDFTIGNDGATTTTSGRLWFKSQGTTFRINSDGITADYSEFFYTNSTSSSRVVGTVMVADSSTTSPVAGTGMVKPSAKAYDKNIIGVVTDKGTGYNNPDDDRQFKNNFANVGMLGHVPVKISTSTSAIEIGDYITSSGESGKAMKAEYSGMVIGTALESYNPAINTSTNPTVLVLVKPEYAIVNNTFVLGEDDGQLASATSTPNLSSMASSTLLGFLINQKGSGSLLQLQQNGQDRLLVGNNGSVNILAMSSSTSDIILNVQNGTTSLFTINAVGDVTTKGHITVGKDTAGTAIIKAGDDQVTINFDAPYLSVPKVVVSVQGLPDFYYGVATKTVESFVIKISKPATTDTTFDWVALAQPEDTTFVSSQSQIQVVNLQQPPPLAPQPDTNQNTNGEVAGTSTPPSELVPSTPEPEVAPSPEPTPVESVPQPEATPAP